VVTDKQVKQPGGGVFEAEPIGNTLLHIPVLQ